MLKQKIDPSSPIKEASEEVKKIMVQVLKLEQERLYENQPRINGEVLNIIKDAVQ